VRGFASSSRRFLVPSLMIAAAVLLVLEARASSVDANAQSPTTTGNCCRVDGSCFQATVADCEAALAPEAHRFDQPIDHSAEATEESDAPTTLSGDDVVELLPIGCEPDLVQEVDAAHTTEQRCTVSEKPSGSATPTTFDVLWPVFSSLPYGRLPILAEHLERSRGVTDVRENCAFRAKFDRFYDGPLPRIVAAELVDKSCAN
jgi:hypothetical protein